MKDQESGAVESWMHQQRDNPHNYADMLILKPGEWYRKWIVAALHSGNQSKILRKEMALANQ